MLINQYIKNVDFHNITTTFDNLYKDSKSNKIFTKLVDLISSESNILLAYKNIKESKNNQIIGIDNKTIEYIDSLSIQELQKIIVSKTNDYKPKPIKKIEISNISGKIRPLGVPCIIDRLFQQCIRQVLEPICEAKFYNYSYGFRPNRTINHAIARTYFLMQKNKLSYCVNIDIEGIFEKIDHEILIKQMWNLGIQDKKLLSIIKTMLNTKIVLPNKSRITEVTGCYQTGILAPLLINIVLNDLDWWIATQWSDFETKKNYERERTHNGKIYIDKSNKYTELKKTSNLKEMYIVRYAEEFKIFCRNYSDAKKIYVAITQWLKIRLKLDVNEENSNIINLRQKYIDFLGFKIKLKKKSNKWVVQSHINDLSLQQIKLKLVNIIKEISKSNSKKTFYELLNQYNATVLGIHQFYSIATDISIDLQHLGLELERIIYNRLGNSYKIEKIGNFETNSIIKKNTG